MPTCVNCEDCVEVKCKNRSEPEELMSLADKIMHNNDLSEDEVREKREEFMGKFWKLNKEETEEFFYYLLSQ